MASPNLRYPRIDKVFPSSYNEHKDPALPEKEVSFMVKDNLKNAMQYAGLGERFKTALEYILTHDLTAATERIELDGKNLYILPQNPTLKTWEAARWESHEKYADIQVVLEGREIIAYAPVAAMDEVTVPYNPEKDVTFYQGNGAVMELTDGDFAIYFPQDAHKPCVRPEGAAETVRKAVVKVKL